MKNWERYESEIRRLNTLAFSKNKNTFGYCENTVCDNCDFETDETADCRQEKINWLYEEVEPILTKRERAFCEMFCFADAKWLARHENGLLNLFYIKPHKTKTHWANNSINSMGAIDSAAFPFITWEDKEPWSIADLLKLEVE